ncbi:MAG: hypothetical protein ACKVT0_14300 [Planctomycetaceae bacterium]
MLSFRPILISAHHRSFWMACAIGMAIAFASLFLSHVTTASGADSATSREQTAVNAVQGEHSDVISIKSITVGIQNRVRLGRWSPVVVEVKTTQALDLKLSVTAATPDGNLSTFPTNEFDLTKTGLHRLESVFMMGRGNSEILVTIHAKGTSKDYRAEFDLERRLAPSTASIEKDFTVLAADQTLIVTLGNPAGFIPERKSSQPNSGDVAQGSAVEREFRADAEVVPLAEWQQLPEQFAGLEGMGILVISDQYQWDAKRDQAVRNWVQAGGHLILSVGKNSSDYQNSLFAKWVPCEVQGEIFLRELSSLESYAKASSRLPIRGRISAVKVQAKNGVTLATSIDGPILVRNAYGFGQVTFLGLNLSQPPLSNWDLLPIFNQNLCDLSQVEVRKSGADRFAKLSKSNITDLSTQLQASQEIFPQVNRVAVWAVIGWMILCLVVIGVGDFLLVRYFIRRPEWTWITFPIIVSVSVGLAAWGATQSNGRQTHVNLLNLLDIDVENETLRAHSWSTIYSPESRRFPVRVEPADGPFQSLLRTADSGQANASQQTDVTQRPRLGWYGIPETSYGGMYRTGGFNLSQAQYEFGSDSEDIANLPIPIWSARTLHSQMAFPTRPLFESQLVTTGVGQLKGTIIHHLPVPLEDWFVAFGGNVYRPRISTVGGVSGNTDLPPGRPWDPGRAGVFRRQLKEFLTGTIATRSSAAGKSEQIVVEQTPYRADESDAYDIFKMMTFYKTVGGKEYTSMNHYLLGEFDCSRQLALDRAVLFGRVKLPVSQLKLDGEIVEPAREFTVIRVLLPVTVQLTEVKALPKFDPNAQKVKNVFEEDNEDSDNDSSEGPVEDVTPTEEKSTETNPADEK